MSASDESYKDAISRAGYALEQRVEAACAAAGMETRANEPMIDPVTGKPRETDLIATWTELRAANQIWERPGVGAVLLIECIRNNTPLVFYEKPATYVECGRLPTLFGCPLFLEHPPGSSGYARLEDQAEVSWCTTLSTVATQWHGFEAKGAKLVASQRHDVHGTFEKLVTRAELAADQQTKPGLIEAAFLGGWLTFLRPVLVVGGSLRSLTLQAGSQVSEERRHVHYLRKSIVTDRRATWIVDVVTEAEVPAYLARLRDRMHRTERFCMESAASVQAALRSTTAQRLCMTLRPPPCGQNS